VVGITSGWNGFGVGMALSNEFAPLGTVEGTMVGRSEKAGMLLGTSDCKWEGKSDVTAILSGANEGA
jgi:hypothetical protein